MADIKLVETLPSRWQPVSVGGTRRRYREDPYDRAGDGSSGFQGHRLHDVHAHGRGSTLQEGRPLGAHPAHGSGNAEYAAAIHVHGIPLYFVGDGASGVHGAGVPRSGARAIGIRRFCLADPMNDADSNVACARMVKEGGGEYVIAALVFYLEPRTR